MKVDPYKVEMANVAKELGGNLVIKYHTATISLTCEQLQTIKENGFPTDIMSCVMAGFMMSGKTEEETMAFLKEADEAKAEATFKRMAAAFTKLAKEKGIE